MALTATMFSLDTDLSDVDRGTYVSLSVRLALQPSETLEFMLTRYLAYCLEYSEGIELTEGIAAGEHPAILVRDLTGRITAWIEVGLPDAQRLHRGSKLAGRAAVYTHRDVPQVLAELNGKNIYRADRIPVYSFGRGFVESVASAVKRRTRITLSITERHLYMDIDGRAFSTVVEAHRIH